MPTYKQPEFKLGHYLIPKSYDCKHGFALRVRIPGVPDN